MPPIASTGDGLSLGVSLVLLEIPDDDWVRQAIVTALNTLTMEWDWREVGSNSPELSAQIFSLILQTLQFDYEPPTMIEVGSMSMYAGSTAPAGWLKCLGQSLLRADYPDLFAVCGTAFGAVDGTHFNIPDMENRSPMGAGSFIALGGHLGAPFHTLNSGENGVHTHLTTETPHSHPERLGTGNLAAFQGAGSGGFAPSGGVSGTTTRIFTDAVSTALTIQNSAGGNPHNNVHPVTGLNYIIYTGLI